MRVLTPAQRQQFEHEGYLVVEDVLDPARDIAPIMTEYAEVVDGIARSLYEDGVIPSLYRELPFDERLIRMCAESGHRCPAGSGSR